MTSLLISVSHLCRISRVLNRPKSCANQARTHHAIDDGMRVVDALGRKLLHVLVNLRSQPAKLIHAHVLLASFKLPTD